MSLMLLWHGFCSIDCAERHARNIKGAFLNQSAEGAGGLGITKGNKVGESE